MKVAIDKLSLVILLSMIIVGFYIVGCPHNRTISTSFILQLAVVVCLYGYATFDLLYRNIKRRYGQLFSLGCYMLFVIGLISMFITKLRFWI